VVGLSILSGSHVALVPETIRLIREAGLDTPVIVGGIIPDVDQPGLIAAGVARIYTPKDFRLSVIMGDVADLGIAHRRSQRQAPGENGSRRATGAPMEKP
jgi:(2R)-ethylmalonyl-CoA mutase